MRKSRKAKNIVLVLLREAMKRQARKARWDQMMSLSKPLMSCSFLESEKHDLLPCRFKRGQRVFTSLSMYKEWWDERGRTAGIQRHWMGTGLMGGVEVD